jgi:adenylate cyclase
MAETVTSQGARRAIRVPLKLKLSLLITALVVLAVAFVGFFLLREQEQSLTVEMIKRGRTIAENLAAGAKTALAANDELSLNLLVRDGMKDPDVAYVVIADHDGTVLAHPDVAQVGQPLVRPPGLEPVGNEATVRSYRTAALGRVIDFAEPLVFSGVRLGALYVGFSEKPIAAALDRARQRALVITVVMVAVGIAGAVLLATLLARPIFRLVQGTRAIAAGNFGVALKVTSRDELGLLTASFNDMARSLREKEMIKRAFTRYVAREVVEEILKDPERLALTGERRQVTVLFCDLRGFTPLSERLNPEQVVSLLNEFYTLAIETVFQHDGTLDKFMGDAVMAVFGAPIPHRDHALRAVKTALALRERFEAFNADRAQRGLETIGAGIGVSVGEVVAGTVGTEDRMEYTVIGDSVNLAARLESNAKSGQILISHPTWELVRDQVEARPLGPIRVKGKEEEVEVHELVGLVEEV